MQRRRLVLFAIACASAVACLFPSVADLTSGDSSTDVNSDSPSSTDASNDVSAKDVSAKDVAVDVATDVSFADATNLLLNPGFEQGVGGCGTAWGTNNAFASQSTKAHTGQFSCQVCQANTPGSYYIHPLMNVPIEGGVAYYFEAYVMAAAAEAGAVAQQVKISFRPFDDAGNVPDAALGTSPAVAAPTAWQKISFTHTAAAGTVTAQVFFVSNDDASTPSCFLVDDVAMFSQ